MEVSRLSREFIMAMLRHYMSSPSEIEEDGESIWIPTSGGSMLAFYFDEDDMLESID